VGGDKKAAEDEQRYKREQLTLTSSKAPAAADIRILYISNEMNDNAWREINWVMKYVATCFM
jgi:hypothetical protein